MSADDTEGDCIIQQISVGNQIASFDSSGDWQIRQSIMTDITAPVSAEDTTGDRQIE
jgi:hypothetical protein